MARHRPNLYGDDLGTPKKQEDRIAKKVDGKRQRGSGCSRFAKGDVDAARFLIECKRTDKASLSVKKEWLKKITREATAVQKVPCLAIEISGDIDPLCENDWFLVPASVFRMLTSEE